MAISRHSPVFYAFTLPNAAVGIMLIIQAASSTLPSGREFWRTLAYSLVYANVTGLFGGVIVGGGLQRLMSRYALPQVRSVFVAPLAMVFIVTMILPGVLLSHSILLAIGVVSSQRFWPEYFRILRTCIPLGVVFGLGGMAYGTLWERVQAMRTQLKEKELAEERSRKLAAEARLRSLESRIHPHFLFNTLNSISSLIAVDPKGAEQMVGRLALLLRFSLDTSNQPLIPLQEELKMVDSYVEIERARFGDKLHGFLNFPAELLEWKVPPMSVQTLVENAVKHGITPQGDGEFEVTASSEDGELRIEVRDTGPGFDLTQVRAGHGLDNLVERLDALFGEKSGLKVTRSDGHSVVEMVIPLI